MNSPDGLDGLDPVQVVGGFDRLEPEEIRRLVDEYEQVPLGHRKSWLKARGFSRPQISQWTKMIVERGAPPTYISRPKRAERLSPASKAVQVVEYQRAVFQRAGDAERWAAREKLNLGSVTKFSRELGFACRVREVSPAERIAALQALDAAGDETQAVRWLLIHGVPGDQARSWREAYRAGRLELPGGADLAQARRVWERPHLSPEQKWDRIRAYVDVLSRGSQVTAGLWLRDQRLTWWELDDWCREFGVVPDQERDTVARWFGELAGQVAVPVVPADHGHVDAPGIGVDLVQGWGESLRGLDPMHAGDPMPDLQVSAGPSRHVGLPAGDAVETGGEVFVDTGGVGVSSSGGLNSADDPGFGGPDSGRGDRSVGRARRLEPEDIRKLVEEYEQVPRSHRAAWAEGRTYCQWQRARWLDRITGNGSPSGNASRVKQSERSRLAGKAAQVVEYQRAMLRCPSGGEQWAADTKVKTNTLNCWLGELGFVRRGRVFSLAEKVFALEMLSAGGDGTQAVRWLLIHGVPGDQARSWREARRAGRLELPGGADLAQARRVWERPQLSPEQKWDRIRAYVTVLSRSTQIVAGRWLRGQRLTWWELDDWYREPGVVPEQERDVVASAFDGPAGQVAVPVAPGDYLWAGAGEVDTGLVQGWGERLQGLESRNAGDPMVAPQVPAGPSHRVGLPSGVAMAGLTGETERGAFAGISRVEASWPGGPDFPEAESLSHRLFQGGWLVDGVGTILRDEPFLPGPGIPTTGSPAINPAGNTTSGNEIPPWHAPASTPPAASPTQWWTTLLRGSGSAPDTDHPQHPSPAAPGNPLGGGGPSTIR